jgi:hypothetical protein
VTSVLTTSVDDRGFYVDFPAGAEGFMWISLRKWKGFVELPCQSVVVNEGKFAQMMNEVKFIWTK